MFQSTHPTRGATASPEASPLVREFQSTHPTRGATRYCATLPPSRHSFNPRTPHGVRRIKLTTSASRFECFNPRTPHGVRRGGLVGKVHAVGVSIHAPHTGCDGLRSNRTNISRVSIHAPHTGCDSRLPYLRLGHLWFQSTHPTRGATHDTVTGRSVSCFNPRTPHGVRQHICRGKLFDGTFQSTHPTRGATLLTRLSERGVAMFQSTHPTRGATAYSIKV